MEATACLVNIILGLLGGLLGGWLYGQLGIGAGSGMIGSIIVAFIGAVILVGITRLIKRASSVRRLMNGIVVLALSSASLFSILTGFIDSLERCVLQPPLLTP